MIGFAASVVFAACMGSVHAQSSANPVNESHDPYQVFVAPRDDGRDNLIFVDLLLGEERRLALTGTRYTITPDSVMFEDRLSGRVQIASPDGSLRDHPFVQATSTARRVDWALTANQIAWTVTTGDDTALSTQTWAANADGSNYRLLFTDGPRSGIRAYPVAFSQDESVLYMDYQPDTIGDLTPLRQYAGLFALDLTTGAAVSLPGEPGCFCGAGFGKGWFLRLALASGGFDLQTFRFSTTALPTENRIAALNYPDFTQGGGVLIDANGAQAVYALTRIGNLTAGRAANDATVIILVDLLGMRQRAVTTLDGLFRPIMWLDDDSGILLTDPRETATWKLSLDGGTLTQIAQGMVLGTLRYNSAYG